MLVISIFSFPPPPTNVFHPMKDELKVFEPRKSDFLTSDISVALRETILAISNSIETGSPVETEIVRVVSLTITEKTAITRLTLSQTTLLGSSKLKQFADDNFKFVENGGKLS